ncbi:MAG TPA: hypothetical protein VM328_14015 [Fimbriimonadaceae bacterium]|nr:hypothetical protein [Fimbriimonadaceae bacterium]
MRSRAFCVFTFDGYGLPVAERLQQEGHDVLVGQVENQEDVLSPLEASVERESEEVRQRRLSQYDGILDKQPAHKVIEKLRRRKKPTEIFLFFDLNHLYRIADQVRDLGFPGNFPTLEDYNLEIDREAAKRFVAERYPMVRVAQNHRFKRVAQARRFLKDTDDVWVLKGLEEDARTVVPDVDDPTLAAGQVLEALESSPESYESAGFLLELRIARALELTPQKLYWHGEPLAAFLCIENKPLGAGNVGPMTDCAMDLGFPLDLDAKIVQMAFPPAIDDMARSRSGLFVWDASLLFDPRTGRATFGEFCANRVGYNSFYTELALAGSAGEYFSRVSAGRSPYYEAVAASCRLFNLHAGAGTGIEWKTGLDDAIWLRDARRSSGRIETAGYKDDLAVLTGGGKSVGEAVRRLYRAVDGFSFEGAYYRPKSDFLSRDYPDAILNRLDFGLQRGLYKIGFGIGA